MVKKKEIRNLIQSQKSDIICIQETKMEVIERSSSELMWGSGDKEFEFKLPIGRSGGLLSMCSS